MQRKGMRKVSFFLALIIFCTSVWFSFAQTVYAKQPSDILKEKLESLLENAPDEIAREILMSLGIVLIDLDSFWSDSAVIELYKSYLKDAYAQGLIGIVDSGFFVSQSVVEHTKEVFDEYISSTPEAVDVVWLPTVSSDKVRADWFFNTDAYYKFRSWTDDKNLSLVYVDQLTRNGGTTHYMAFSDAEDFIFIHGNTFSGGQKWANLIPYSNLWLSNWGMSNTSVGTLGGIIPFRSDLTLAEYADLMPNHIMKIYNGSDTLESSDYILNPENDFGDVVYQYPFNSPQYSSGWYRDSVYVLRSALFVRGCNTDAPSYFPLFKDKSTYMNWITGQGSYYKFDSGYQGGDITINPNADYSAITDAIADVMKQSIANGDNMSTMLSRMQAAFSKTLAEISGTLDDIGDNTAETNSWLEKIFGLLETQQKEMQDYFKSAQESLDQIPDQISGAAQDIADAIQNTGQAIVDAVSGITAGGGGSPPVIAPGDYPDGDQVDSSSGKSLWTLLGEGIAKIITAVLNLLKVLIFKGLDALGYLAGVMIDNIGDVFSGIGAYFDRYIDYIEENTFFAGINDILPEELKTIMVLTFFSIAIAGIIKYAKKG